MDAILSALANLGLSGLMVAVLIWFLWHLVTKTLPDREAAGRQALADLQRTFATTLERVEGRWERTTEAICTKLAALDEDMRQTREEMVALRGKLCARAAEPKGARKEGD